MGNEINRLWLCLIKAMVRVSFVVKVNVRIRVRVRGEGSDLS